MVSKAASCAVVFFASSAPVLAGAGTAYDDEATFLAQAGTLMFESFEGLAQVSDVDTVSPDDFVMTTSADDLDLVGPGDPWDGFPTDGTKFVGWDVGASRSLTFQFDAPIFAVGFDVVDWGDFSPDGAELMFQINAGPSAVIATAPLPSGNELFFGFIWDEPFDVFTILRPPSINAGTNNNDALAIDAVHYGIPAPGSLAVLGLLAVGFTRRR